MNKNILLVLLLFILCPAYSQYHTFEHKHDTHEIHGRSVSFIKNLGQWENQVAFKASFGGVNTMFLEQNGFTFVLTNPEDVEQIHDVIREEGGECVVNAHAYKVQFKNSKSVAFSSGEQERRFHNYFIGDDPQKWASKVPIYNSVMYEELYDGIDLNVYSLQGNLKYDFIIRPGADPGNVELEYEGVDFLEIDNDNLFIGTSLGNTIETKPVAYQIINDEKVKVSCAYKVEGKTVSYIFPNGYDTTYELIIDPVIIAATLSGTTGFDGNFGHVAAFDRQGNIYNGGRSFGMGFPTTMGAFQMEYSGGETDISVVKYSPEGTAQIYATYIGGSSSEIPHSIVTNSNGELILLGTTSSTNYPTTNNAFQSQIGGDRDIVVTHLNSDGTALMGSTYIGGQGADGINNSSLNANYDDTYRGEVISDDQGDIYIASCTASSDFPTTPGAFDTTFNQDDANLLQDAVVFKLNNDLSTLLWSTFLGGDDPDTAFGIRVDNSGVVYVTGIAGADNFPTTSGTVQANWEGGEEKAYVAILDSMGSDIIASTFWGSTGDEHGFLLDLDEDNNIHIYGQTTGEIPVTPNTYFANTGSRQFISAFSNRLEELVYSTVIGNGSGVSYDFVPVAFMVDKCNSIYFSGYYAEAGLPITSDALSNGPGTFYIGVLEPNASDLRYGTYYGDADHVDGGMSRFDEYGNLYQAVCSCTSSGLLNTSAGAFAEGQATFCDIGVFKIDFEANVVKAIANAIQSQNGSAPYEVNFESLSQNATEVSWDFDDNGAMSFEETPTHIFEEEGTYEVELIASNSESCNLSDTIYLTIQVNGPTSAVEIDNNVSLRIEPNPAQPKQMTNLVTKGNYEGQLNCFVMDCHGRLLYEKSFMKNGEEDRFSLETPQVAGVYFVHLKSQNYATIKTLRMVVL